MPAQTMFGLLGASAISPTDIVAKYGSETAVHVVPLFVVRNTPPDALATKMMRGVPGTASMSSTRPPNDAGPICRQLVALGHGTATAARGSGSGAAVRAGCCASVSPAQTTHSATARVLARERIHDLTGLVEELEARNVHAVDVHADARTTCDIAHEQCCRAV